MTLVEVREALVGYFVANWSHSNVPVVYDNIDSLDLTQVPSGFIRFSVVFDNAAQANVSFSPFYRLKGYALFQVFVPTNTGSTTLYGYIDELMSTFKYVTLQGLHLQTPIPSPSKNRDGWFSLELRVPFYTDSNT